MLDDKLIFMSVRLLPRIENDQKAFANWLCSRVTRRAPTSRGFAGAQPERSARKALFDVNHQEHLGVDGAPDVEGASHREGNIRLAAGLLIAGIEVEGRRFDVGVMA